MRHPRPTISDVAKRVGVHRSTASRALDPLRSHMISPTVVAKVIRAAAELGFPYPDQASAGADKRRLKRIAMLVPDMSNTIFPEMMRGAEQMLFDAGFFLEVACSNHDATKARKIYDSMEFSGVCGVILATASRSDEIVAHCRSVEIPLVAINRTTDDPNSDAVVVDGVAGASLAVDHLVEFGHREVCIVVGPESVSTGFERLNGFLRACARHGISVPPERIVHVPTYTKEQGQEAGRKVLAGSSPPTGVFVANDLLALGFFQAVTEAGFKCPSDISIVGFNDMPLLEFMLPQLTTVQAPFREMGAAAAELLLQQIKKARRDPQKIVLQPRLVERASVDWARGASKSN